MELLNKFVIFFSLKKMQFISINIFQKKINNNYENNYCTSFYFCSLFGSGTNTPKIDDIVIGSEI